MSSDCRRLAASKKLRPSKFSANVQKLFEDVQRDAQQRAAMRRRSQHEAQRSTASVGHPGAAAITQRHAEQRQAQQRQASHPQLVQSTVATGDSGSTVQAPQVQPGHPAAAAAAEKQPVVQDLQQRHPTADVAAESQPAVQETLMQMQSAEGAAAGRDDPTSLTMRQWDQVSSGASLLSQQENDQPVRQTSEEEAMALPRHNEANASPQSE